MPRYLHDQWKEMLQTLAKRDGSVELSRRMQGDEELSVNYRTRLFEVLEDGNIIVETPKRAVQDKSFGNGDDIDLTLMYSNERLVATCTVLETFIQEIKPGMRLLCYRLSPGRRPQREQRRDYYRVNIAAMDLELAKFTTGHDEEVFSFEARMVNLSGGGLGVSVRGAKTVLNKIKRSRDFNCHALLGSGIWVDAPVRVAHLEAIGDDGLYIGFQFDLDDAGEAQALEDMIAQRCVEFQRMQLKKRRA